MIVNLNDLEVLRTHDYYQWCPALRKWYNPKAYLSIVVTNACQMNCPYCINSNTDRDLSMPLYKALDNITRLVREYKVKECVILGGEPLLYPQLLPLIDGLRELAFEKIVITTNGIMLTDSVQGKPMYEHLFEHGITHLNISVHNETQFIPRTKLAHIYAETKKNYPEARVRINTNIWKGNHDKLSTLIPWVESLVHISDSIRVSNLIYKDFFSVNDINNDLSSMMMSDDEYNTLFDEYINHYAKDMTCINNDTALGFVGYTMIPLRSAVIVNRNINSDVSNQVCENKDSKINTFKCLVTGDISLSWNTNNIINI